MSLALTKIPDRYFLLGPGGIETGWQAQPAASDYVTGGYAITAAQVGLAKLWGGTLVAGNAAAAQYSADFALPAGSFGTNPNPASSLNVVVSLPASSVAPGTPLGLIGAVSAAASTTVGVVTNLITVTQPNSLVAGQFVLYTSTGAGAAFSGTILEVASATASVWTAVYNTPNITAATADTTITYQLVGVATGNLLAVGTGAVISNSLATTSLITMTCANTFVPGQFVICQGLTNGATANGVIVQVATASSTQFTANWTGTSFTTLGDAGFAYPLVTAGNAPVVSGATTVIGNTLAAASSAGVAGIITLTLAPNNYVPNNILVVQGCQNGAALNGDIAVVLATSLSNAEWKFNHKQATVNTGADTGIAAILVTGVPTTTPQPSPGTDLSACYWDVKFLGY